MLKLIVAVLIVALAGTAGAAGWKDLRIDGTSEAAFQRSLTAFNDALSPERHQVFTAALMDIWLQGTAEAKINERLYTVSDYHSQLNGLSYEQVVTFTDPTGETAKQRYEQAKRTKIANPTQPAVLATPPAELRALDAHSELDQGELMKTRNGTGYCGSSPQTGRTGTPCKQ